MLAAVLWFDSFFWFWENFLGNYAMLLHGKNGRCAGVV